ncbi:MAG: hypothetical protein RL748_679 [Pseudomonadota bacterium]|jgi:RNA polymerase sigma factor for flagellar operon FliA
MVHGMAVIPDKYGVDPEQALRLWLAWEQRHEPEQRVKLIDLYLPFARMMAAKLYARRSYPELEFMDYLQYATVGLLESIDRFERQRGVSFETYAGVRIKGAILNGIASLSEKQEQVQARQRVLDARLQALQPETTAQADAMPIDAVFASLAELAIGLAMGFVLEDTGMFQAEPGLGYHDNTYQRVEMRQLQERMHHYLAALPENENRILSYHYLQHLGFEEIARLLGVSRGRISQLHKQALARMRKLMEAKDGIDLHL